MTRLLWSIILAAMMPMMVSGAIVYSGSQNVALQLTPTNSMSSAGIDVAGAGDQWDDFRVNLWLDMGMMTSMCSPGMMAGMMTMDTRLAIYAPGGMMPGTMSPGMGMSTGMSMSMGMSMGGILGFMNQAMNLPRGAIIGPGSSFQDWAYLYKSGGIDDDGGYIGVMTPDGRYGWLRVQNQSGIGTDTHSVVFDGGAYEDRPGIAVAAGEGPCDWLPGGPHKMHWPQPPDLSPAGVDVSDVGTVLADDFKCMAGGPISRIHIWASFADDVLPARGVEGMAFEVSIYSNAPAAQNAPARPGTALWTRAFAPGEYAVRMIHDGPEGWCDPLRGDYQKDNHRQAYQYNFCADKDPFVQQEGTVYWLAVKLLDPANSAHKFGWKGTCPEFRWNNDAVYLAVNGSWRTLAYPSGHEYAGQSLDLAFVIDSGRDLQAKYDLGDAPDSSNSLGTEITAYPKDGPHGTTAHFPTVYQAGSPPYGPLHRSPKDTAFLGYGVTLENEADLGPDMDPTNNLDAFAGLSDADGADDGVIVPLVLPDARATTFDYAVTVVNPQATHLYVNVWFDWNRDGDWDDAMTCADGAPAPEWAVQNQELHLPGIGPHTITTPQFRSWHPTVLGDLDPLWMRITLSDTPWNASQGAGGAGPANGYLAGETEDYYFQPKNEPAPTTYDWGDAPDERTGGYPTLATHSGARHAIAGPWFGNESGVPDTESDGRPDPNALADDTDGSDDEEGVWIPPLVQGEPVMVTLTVGGGGGIVQAWIDFNGDSIWQTAEQVANGYLPDGTHTLAVFVPPDAVAGQSFARFRISSRGGLTPEGPAPDGEVEDYDVSIRTAPPYLKRVQWPDLTANGIDIRVDNSDGKTRWLADDFKCTSTNRVTGVRLWGSWKNDRKGAIEKISLTIRPDDPVGSAGSDKQNRFSKPGPEVLWTRSFGPGQFAETSYHIVRDVGEWWWDPAAGQLIAGGDTEVWQIDVAIDPKDAFLQQGTPAAPIIYWLQVQVETTDGQFGWKTRRWPDHYQDDAVWDMAAEKPDVWKELRYPKNHPYYSLEQNSIDMSFALTYTAGTDDVADHPTTRPGCVTQCPVVETQCPAVETRCPAVKTQCPMYSTRCPTVRTKCPSVSTQCPMVTTRCPAVKTQCPASATKCPASKTKCPAVTTRCPASTTKCPPTATNCQAVETQCPAVATQCPASLTKCPPTATQCQAVETQCPAVATQCPTSSTKCPPTATQCQAIDTQCPSVATKCPAVSTQCPTSSTKCPPTATQCQAVDTQCPAVETKCPASSTKCPVVSTQCPPATTKCPPTVSQCQTVQTECPAVETRCPASSTKCPAVSTQCPLSTTKCPPTVTACQTVQTECPAVQTQCPIVSTSCPTSSTKCPATDTRCPPVSTQCPSQSTSCPAVSTRCPSVKTQCPSPCKGQPLSILATLPCPALEVLCPSFVVAKR